MRVLVTGHKGFIGSHFFRHFKNHGHSVLGIDIRGKRHIDARDFFRVSTVPFNLIVHCAATIPSIDERTRNALTVANDLAIDAEMFQWALRTQPEQVIYFSSCTAYPGHFQHDQTCLREDDIDLWSIRHPDSMYGFTKLAGELQAQELRRHGVDVRVFRPFSGYGEDQSLNYPFPSMIDRALRRESPFEIWGDGHQVRDFVHVDDVVGAVLAACDEEYDGPLNIGTGRPTSMRELARLIFEQIPGYNPPLRLREDKPAGNRYLCAATLKLAKHWEPKVTLEEGIRRALVA